MSLKSVEAIHDLLSDANTSWPRFPFSLIEKRVAFLERRLARAVGLAEIEYCISSGHEVADGTTKYEATLFTSDLVISGSLLATDIQNVPYPPQGDVAIVPRSAIRSLTLHHVEYYGDDDNGKPDYVSFTATFDGLPPVFIGLPGGRGAVHDGTTSRLFDALQADLQGVLTHG
jgi:hypothetical protein